MNNFELEKYLNNYLKPHKIKDYCPNGLQVQGKSDVKRIITGVTASQALIDRAIEENADAILVHHGYFWKNEPASIRGMKYNRLSALIKHDINLYAYHLPLDVHSLCGNNILLANALNIINVTNLEDTTPSIALQGEFSTPILPEVFAKRLEVTLNRLPLHIVSGLNQPIKTIGWCTGGGQDYIDLAVEKGLDAFISGEISERTTHTAKEMGIHYFSAGHHATERYGVKALGEWVSKELGLDVTFIDVPNPV
jgi:dinuclear metal center YbgI/SA1388 family protein